MKIINMHEAKTHLSRIVEEVRKGEPVIIGKSGKPMAILSPYIEETKSRKPGSMKGKIWISDDFDADNDLIADKRIYIETSVPSFYYERRESPEMIARREWTRQWWKTRRGDELVTSDAVFYELDQGDYPSKQDALELLAGIPVVEVADEITDIVKTHTEHHVMPADPLGDALHLALASFHKCDFLLTWNCQNLANPNKFAHIRIINSLLGLFVPELVTPYQLLEETR